LRRNFTFLAESWQKKRSERAARKLEKTAATFTGGGMGPTAEDATKSTRYTASDVRHTVEQRDECRLPP
jgi:molybdopterin-biosynthesis enzyme MoeA-like protein